MKHAAFPFASTFGVLVLCACGSTDFAGKAGIKNGSKDKTPDGDIGADQEQIPEQSGDAFPAASSAAQPLTWSLPCEPGTPAVDEPAADAIAGPGSYVMEDSSAFTELTVRGEFCPDATPPRDVVFMLDASSSMLANDPITGGTCGRLLALEYFIKNFGEGGDIRYGVVTFASGAVTQSTGYFNTKAALYQDLLQSSGNANIIDVLCHSELGTDYNDGFAGVRNLIVADSNPQALRNVFLFSDGEPLFGQTGEAIATELKAGGVIIGTVMMEGNPAILRDNLASKDKTGQPLFRQLTGVGDLATALVDLANRSTNPSIIRYRAVGAVEWLEQVFYYGKDPQFSSKPIAINQATHATGFELEYEYDGAAGLGRVTQRGSLTWVP